MKKSKFYLAFTTIAFAATVFVVSCKKTATTADTDTSSASDNNLAETTSDDISTMAGQVSESSNSTFRTAPNTILTNTTSASAIVAHDTMHKKIAAWFKGVYCADGHIRTGKITFDYSQSAPGAIYYRDPGFKVIITDSAYTDNGNTIHIHKTITNTTPAGFIPASTNETWDVVDTDTITKSGGGTITFTSTNTRTLLNTNTAYHGAAIPISWDSANVSISGIASITDSEGAIFTVTIPTATPLVRDYTCVPFAAYPAYHPFSSGAFNFTPPGKATRYVSFDGKCDNTVTITIDSKTYTLIQ